jgi:hypothetical protein
MTFVTLMYRWETKLSTENMEKILMTTKRHQPTESNQPPSWNNGGIYEVKIKGLLDAHWQRWFEGMTLKHQENVEGEQDYTLIMGAIADQPALHGLLAKIRDLNLTLISVRKIASNESAKGDAQ